MQTNADRMSPIPPFQFVCATTRLQLPLAPLVINADLLSILIRSPLSGPRPHSSAMDPTILSAMNRSSKRHGHILQAPWPPIQAPITLKDTIITSLRYNNGGWNFPESRENSGTFKLGHTASRGVSWALFRKVLPVR